MVTELCSARPASYRNVVWVKLGSDIAGATAPREKADLSETVRFTGPDWLMESRGRDAGKKVPATTYPADTASPCCSLDTDG